MPFRHRVISHRGGGGEQVENSLPAFRASERSRFDMVELDVMLTKDDMVVVFHDDDMERMTGVRGAIGDFAYADLPPLLDTQSSAAKRPSGSGKVDGAAHRDGTSSEPQSLRRTAAARAASADDDLRIPLFADVLGEWACRTAMSHMLPTRSEVSRFPRV